MNGKQPIDETCFMPHKAPILFRTPTPNNRELIEVLPPGSWLGHPAVVIGGGPSLGDFDWRRLKGWRTIGVNLSFEKFDPTINFSMDTRFLNWILNGQYGPEAKDRFLNFKGYKVWLLTYSATFPGDIFVVRVCKHYEHARTNISWHLTDGLCHGNNSGFAAFNLALILGANPIYLLGFDFRFISGKSHWHKGHPIADSEQKVGKYRENFERWAKEIKKRKIEVINLNPGSALRCFDFKEPEEVL